MASEWAREMKHGKNGCWMCNFWWVREIFNVTIFHYFLHVHLTSACSNFHIFRKVSWVTSSLRFFLLFFLLKLILEGQKRNSLALKSAANEKRMKFTQLCITFHLSYTFSIPTINKIHFFLFSFVPLSLSCCFFSVLRYINAADVVY